MAIDRSGPPRNAYLCMYDETVGECATESPDPSMIRMIFQRPLDSGGGDGTIVPIDHYQVQIGKDGVFSGSSFRELNFTDGDTNQDTWGFEAFTNLAAGDSYIGRVRALTAIGNGYWSSLTDARTVVGVPSAPIAVELKTGTATGPRIEMDWTIPTNTGDLQNTVIPLTNYYVQLSNLSDFGAPHTVLVAVAPRDDAMTYTFTTRSDPYLRQGERYYLRVYCSNPLGDSAWSEVLNRILVGVPGAPENPTFSTSAPLEMTTTWAAPGDLGAGSGATYPLTSYQVALNTYSGVPVLGREGTFVYDILPDRTQNIVQVLTQGTSYYLRVRARNDASDDDGYGPWSEEGIGVCSDGVVRPTVCGNNFLIAVDVPSIPLDFAFRPFGSLVLKASWTRPTETGDGSSGYPLMWYEVYFQELGFAAQTILPSDAELEYVSDPQGVGTIHAARVRSVNDAGSSEWTSLAQATAILLPSAPTAVTANANAPFNITVEWIGSDQTGLGDTTWPLVAYEVLVTSECGYVAERTIRISASMLSLEVGGLVKGCVFTFHVRAENAAGFGPYAISNSELALDLSTAPLNLVAVTDRSLQVSLSWDLPSDTGPASQDASVIQHYAVRVFSDIARTQRIRQYRTGLTSLNVLFLEKEVTVYVQVLAVNKAGEGVATHLEATPIIPALQDVTYAVSSQLAGDTITMDVSFRLATELNPQDHIALTFPFNFLLAAAYVSGPIVGFGGAFVVTTGSKPCGYQCEPRDETLYLQLAGGSQVAIDTTLSFTVGGLVNRRWAGDAETFQVRTLNELGNFTIDEALNVSGYRLTAGPLTAVAANFQGATTGEVNSVVVEFSSPRNPLFLDFRLEVEFGDLMIVDGASAVGITPASIAGSMQVEIVGQRVNVRRSDSGGEIPSGTLVQISLDGIRNRLTSGPTGAVAVRSYTSFDGLMDESEGVTGEHVRAGLLTSGSVVQATTVAFATGSYRVLFQVADVGLPIDAVVLVQFPEGVDVTNAAVDPAQSSGFDGQMRLEVQGRNVSFIREGTRTETTPFTLIIMHIDGARNYYVGDAVPFRIWTLLVGTGTGDGLMEYIPSVVGTATVSAKLDVIKMELSDTRTGMDVSLAASLRINGIFNLNSVDGGVLVIEFPDGFEFIGDPTPSLLVASPASGSLQLLGSNDPGCPLTNCPGLTTAPCQSRSWLVCHVLTLELQGGSEWPGGTVFNLTFPNLVNSPLSGTTAPFKIRTVSGFGALSDENNEEQLALIPRSVPVRFEPESGLADAATFYNIYVDAFNVVPPNCEFIAAFPEAVTFPGAVTVSSTTPDIGNLLVALTPVYVQTTRSTSNPVAVQETSGNLTISRVGGLLARRTPLAFRVGPVRHRETSGRAGEFVLETRTTDSVLLEQNLSNSRLYLVYDVPLAGGLEPANAARTGGAVLSLSGDHFGPVELNPLIQGSQDQRSVVIGHSACLSTTWVSDTHLSCLLSGGFVAAADLQLTIEQQSVSRMSFFTYDHHTTTAVSVVNIPSFTTEAVLLGQNFGAWEATIASRVGGSSAEVTMWVSDSNLLCKVTSGDRMDSSLSVSVALLTSTTMGLITHDAPALRMVDTSPEIVVTSLIFGSGFGFGGSAGARAGASSSQQSEWFSDSSITCMSSRSLLSSSSMIVTAAVALGTLTEALSFARTSPVSATTAANLPDEGSPVIAVRAPFALPHHSAAIRMGDTGCERSAWVSDSAVQCATGVGVGASMSVKVTTGYGVGTAFEATSYNRAEVARFAATGNVGSAGFGAETILGVGFGGEGSSLSARAGQSECAGTAWIADTAIRCRFESMAGGSLMVVVTVGEEVASATNAMSYDAPMLVDGAVHVDRMAVHGAAFGHFDTSPRGRSGGSACQNTVWMSLTGLSCLASPGLGNTRPLAVTVLDLAGTVTEAWSFGSAGGLEETAMNFHSQGSFEVVSVSSSFASWDPSAAIRAGSACEVTSWVSDSVLVCKSAISVGGSLVQAVTAGLLVSSLAESISFDPAHGLGLKGASNHARDSHPVSLSGINFGDHDLTQRAGLGFSVMEAVHWMSETSVTSLAAHGTAGTCSLQLTAGVRVTSITEALSFDSLDTVSMAHMNSVHGVSHETTISGAGFGEHDLSQQSRFAATNCEGTIWHSATALGALLPSEVLRTSSISLTAGMRVGSTSDSFSFDANDMHLHVARNGLPSLLTLNFVGTGLATSDFSFGARASTACEQSLWLSESGLSCRVSPGLGGTGKAIVTSSSVGETLSEAWSYDGVTVDRAEQPESAAAVNTAQASSVLLALYGTSIGLFGPSPQASRGFTAGESTVWASDSVLTCAAGWGAGWSVSDSQLVLTASERCGSKSDAISYDVPRVSSSSPVRARLNLGANTTVSGAWFAAVDLSGAVRIGGSGTEYTKWISESSLLCRLSGTAAQQHVSIVHTVGVRAGSISHAVSYTEAHVNEFRPHNAPKSGEDFVSVIGMNFGTFSVSEYVQIGNTHCHPSFWTSDSFILCAVSPSQTPHTDVLVRILEQSITFTDSITFDAPAIHSNLSANVPALEGLDFTVTGLEFGVFSGSARFRFGQTAARSTSWIADTALHALSGTGAASTISAFVTIAVVIGTASDVLSFDSPEVYPLGLGHSGQNGETGLGRVDNQPTRVVTPTRLSGHHLGTYDVTGNLRSGKTACESTTWTSDTMIVTRYAVGSEASLSMSVTAGLRVHTTSNLYSFDVGILLNHSAVNTPRHGIERLVLGASGIGLLDVSLGMRIGYSTSQRTEWLSESSVHCQVRTGFQSSWSSALTIDAQVTTSTGVFSYDAPLITSVGSDVNGPQGEEVALIIEPVGVDPKFSISTRMGTSAAELTLWLSSTTLYVKTRFAVRDRQITDVVLSAGTMVASLTQAHVYDRHAISNASPPNGPTNPIESILFFGQGFGSGVQSASARLSYSSCLETRWRSETALACVSTDGFVHGGSTMALTIQSDQTGTMSHAFTYDGPRLTDISDSFGPMQSQQLLEVYGYNFGVSDPSLNARIGNVGCEVTTWQSDTALACLLRGSNTPADISLADIRGARICRRCPSTQVLVGCTPHNAGHCEVCHPCVAGSFRDGCEPGTDKSGVCSQCPNAGLAEELRTFKPERGNATTQCTPCTVCGGLGHDGTEYEMARCTETQDTTCAACEACTAGVRIGCAQTSPGVCVEIDGNVDSVSSTSSTALGATFLTGTKYYTTEITQVFLAGQYQGHGVTIPADVSVTLSSANSQIAVAVTQPTAAMLRAAASNFSYPYTIVSEITYFHPSGTEFSPQVAKIELVFNDTGVGPHRISIFVWNTTAQTWQEKAGTAVTPGSGNRSTASVETGSFSSYAVLRIPTPPPVTPVPPVNTTANATSNATQITLPDVTSPGNLTNVTNMTHAMNLTTVSTELRSTPLSTPDIADNSSLGDGGRSTTPDPDGGGGGDGDDREPEVWERLEVVLPVGLFVALVCICAVCTYLYKCTGVYDTDEHTPETALTHRAEDGQEVPRVDATLMQSPGPEASLAPQIPFRSPQPPPVLFEQRLYSTSPDKADRLPPPKTNDAIAHAASGRASPPPDTARASTPPRSARLARSDNSLPVAARLHRPDTSPRRLLHGENPAFPMTPPLQPRPPQHTTAPAPPPPRSVPPTITPGMPPPPEPPSSAWPGLSGPSGGAAVGWGSPQRSFARAPSPTRPYPTSSPARPYPSSPPPQRPFSPPPPPPPGEYAPPGPTLTPYRALGMADPAQTPGTAASAKRVAFSATRLGPHTYAARFPSRGSPPPQARGGPGMQPPLASNTPTVTATTAYIAPPNVQSLSPQAHPRMRDERGNAIPGAGGGGSLETTLAMLAMGFSTPMRVSGEHAQAVQRGQASPVDVYASRERERNPGYGGGGGEQPWRERSGARTSLRYEEGGDAELSHVDDVILSIANDYSGRRSGVSDREDTPERFGARVQHDVEAEEAEEAEFSIQPGARRFVSSPRSEDMEASLHSADRSFSFLGDAAGDDGMLGRGDGRPQTHAGGARGWREQDPGAQSGRDGSALRRREDLYGSTREEARVRRREDEYATWGGSAGRAGEWRHEGGWR